MEFSPFFASFLLVSLPAPSAAQIHVNFFDDGDDSIETSSARAEADRILQSARISLTWSNCRPSEPGSPGCATAGPITLQLRLYPSDAASKLPIRADTFGFALSQPAPDFGVYIGIFHQRVHDLAHNGQLDTGKLLGHVIAHEIGHLLLGGGGHAAFGIMQFPWQAKQVDQVRRGELLFLPTQRRMIQENVQVRLRR